MILTITLEVADKLGAYKAVNDLDMFGHKLKDAKLGDNPKETFTTENPPAMFTHDNAKHAKHFKVFK